MINGRITRIARARLAWGALAWVTAGLVHAQTLVGGGSFLPALGFAGSDAASNPQVWGSSTGNTTEPYSTPDYIAPTSLFGVYQAQPGNPAVSYCQTDDDAGKNIFAGITIGTTQYNVQNACVGHPTFYYGNATGFGAALSGVNRSGLTQPNFAAADSPLNASDYLNYQADHASGDYPVQFPALAGAIAIVFNLVDSTGAQVTSSEVNFTDAQLCEIFSGEITTWSDSRLAGAFTLPAGHLISSNPINVQYRTDGSGTTFGLSNHLAWVCGSTITSNVFETNQAFTSMVANFFTTNGVETLPSNWTGSSGELRLVNAIALTPNSIGYVETANALATNPSLQIADVNGTSPVSNFGSPLTLRGGAAIYNAVLITNNTNGTAQLEALSAISGVTNPPTTSCIALVKPALYAKPDTLGGLVPTGTYPIVAVSYLLANSAGNGADLTNTQNLLAFPYTVAQSSVTTIGPGTGLAFLTPYGGGLITASQIQGCLVN